MEEKLVISGSPEGQAILRLLGVSDPGGAAETNGVDVVLRYRHQEAVAVTELRTVILSGGPGEEDRTGTHKTEHLLRLLTRDEAPALGWDAEA